MNSVPPRTHEANGFFVGLILYMLTDKARSLSSQRRKLLARSWRNLLSDRALSFQRGTIMFTIYALRDPRDLQIHYIGLTENHPVWRLVQHLQDKQDKNLVKLTWLAELKTLNTRPDVIVLQFAPDLESALFIERYWIKLGLQAGWPLTNQESQYKQVKMLAFRRVTASKEVVNHAPNDLDVRVQQWRESNPNGTQSELRKLFAEQGLTIARSSLHKVWHKCNDKLGTDITGGA